jgi:hypothetical protein
MRAWTMVAVAMSMAALAGCSIRVTKGFDGKSSAGIGGDGDLGASSGYKGEPSRCAPEGLLARAVCVCGDLHQAGTFVTEGSEGAAGDVGVNGELSARRATS